MIGKESQEPYIIPPSESRRHNKTIDAKYGIRIVPIEPSQYPFVEKRSDKPFVISTTGSASFGNEIFERAVESAKKMPDLSTQFVTVFEDIQHMEVQRPVGIFQQRPNFQEMKIAITVSDVFRVAGA